MKHLPGEIAYTSMMNSSVPALMPQMVGFYGSAKFHNASLFVDDKLDCTFVHNQISTSAEETIRDKEAYETELRQFGKEVRHHHEDNGTYDVAEHREETNKNKQTLTFCGVDSNNQNGRAENRVKIICNPARVILIHAIHRWPEVVKESLWPYSIPLATCIRKNHKINKQRTTPIEKLTGLSQSFDAKNNHAFG